jgi:hypothetical protein
MLLRLFVFVESLPIPLAQGLPFFTLFARRAFNLEVEALGLLILIGSLMPLVGNFVWGDSLTRAVPRAVQITPAEASA